MSNLIRKAEFSIRGIPNQGLTCYLASAIVGLCSLNDFLEFLINYSHEKHGLMNKEKHNLFFRFVQLAESFSSKSNNEYQVQKFFDAFFSSSLSMVIYKRYHFHDSSEFIIDFLCYLDECLNDFHIRHSDPLKILSNENNYKLKSDTHSLIKNSFKLSIKRSQICTLDKTHSKSETDTLMQIFLFIENFETIEQCLDNYFSSTQIDQKINCVHCNEFRKIQICYKLELLSDNLMITFNRKKVSRDNQTKIMKFIRISKRLDFSKHYFCTENVFEDYFELKAIVFHAGNKIEDGHFTSLVRNKNTWKYFNDENEVFVNDMDNFIWKNRETFQIYLLIYSRSENNEFRDYLSEDVEMKKSITAESLMLVDSEAEDNCIREITDFTKCAIDSLFVKGPSSIKITKIHNIQNLKIGNKFESKQNKNITLKMNKEEKLQARKDYKKKWAKEKRMKDTDFKKRQNLISKESMQKKRCDDKKNKEEQLKNKIEHRERRKNEKYKREEQNRNTIEHRNHRATDPMWRQAEQEADTIHHRDHRQTNIEFKDCEQKRNTIEHRNHRATDPLWRQAEQEADTIQHRDHREQSPVWRAIEQERDTNAKRVKRQSLNYIIKVYEDGIVEGPTMICVCCGGTFFKRSVQKFTLNRDSPIFQKIFNVDMESDNGNFMICLTCNKYVQSKRPTIPQIALSNGLAFPVVDERLKILNDLEERLCSPRVAFIRIKDLQQWDHQKKMCGNVVNVPIDTQRTLEKLPRNFNESETIQIKFKRKIGFEQDYKYDQISPIKVIEAVKYLVKKPLFTKNGIHIENSWFEQFNSKQTVDFIIEEEDRQEYKSCRDISLIDDEECQTEELVFNNEEDEEEFDNIGPETMIVDVVQQTSIIAPGEGIAPQSIIGDQDAEELTFLKIYNGEQFRTTVAVKFGMRCKSEFRRFDRRCAENIEKIFYDYKKLVQKKINSAIELCMRKTNEIASMTVTDALNKDKINDLLVKNQAHLFLRTIRSSPQYWELKKMELNSMIRQLGCPTFFITFSPAEIDWPELICVLVKIKHRKVITRQEALGMRKDEKIDLVSKDPVTVARYFENRLMELLKYCHHLNGPFRDHPIYDYFWRVEFQKRGSPHIHMLTWNKGAPVYDSNKTGTDYQENVIECTNFIDKYTSCSYPISELVQENDYPERTVPIKSSRIAYQLHKKCKENCKIKNERDETYICKYGFPWPILLKTIIIEPMKKDDENFKIARKNYFKIKEKLVAIDKEVRSNQLFEITLDELLRQLDLTFDEYKQAFSSTIHITTVFHKRTCRDLRVNPYNSELFVRHRANMDIKFVVDAYGAAAYVSAYMLKSNRTMSRILKNVIDETQKGNWSVKDRLLRVASKFMNCSEISAQECVYTLLSMPVSRTSRENIYVNTFPSKERNVILKEDRLLELMNPESRNIFKGGLLTHYKNRPKTLKDTCLAEFAGMYEYFSNDRAKNSNDFTRVGLFADDDEHLDEDDNEGHFVNEELASPSTEDNTCIETQQSDDSSFNATILSSIDNCKEIETNNDALKTNKEKMIKLLNNDGYIKRRNKAKIIRFKRYSEKKDPKNYYRVELMLFVPWYNESKEVECDKPFDRFVEKKEIIARNRANFQSIIVEDFNLALESIEKQIEQETEKVIGDEAETQAYINDFLVTDEHGGEFRELFEKDYGFQCKIQDKPSCLQQFINEDKKSLKLPDRLDRGNYINHMCSLNREQQIYIANFLASLKAGQSFFHFINGKAGTGKSHLIKAIYQTLIRFFVPSESKWNSSKVFGVLGAYTGKAAFNIKGSTLHSLFHLTVRTRKNCQVSNEMLNIMRKKFKHLKLLIIDEVSMIGWDLFRRLNIRLQEIMGNKEYFGGVSMIVVGDFNQLPPVMDSMIFERKGQALTQNNSYTIDNLASVLQQGPEVNVLWVPFRLFVLGEIMRQRNDKSFTDALEVLGDLGVNGLTDIQIEMFNRQICRRDRIPDEALCLNYENEHVDEWNKEKLNRLSHDKSDLFCCENRAIDMASGTESYLAEAKNLAAICKQKKGLDETANLPNLVRFVVGCRYYVTNNMDISDGLVNGAVGILRKIVYTKKRQPDIDPLVKRVYLDFGDLEIGQAQRSSLRDKQVADKLSVREQREWTPLPFSEEIIDRAKSGKKYHIVRKQFSLVEAESITIHKSQGQTCPSVAVGLSDRLTRPLLYVAFSRATKLNDLYLYGSDSILKSMYRSNEWTEDRRISHAKKEAEKNRVQIEMNRLKSNSMMENRFKFLESQEDNHGNDLSILFCNIQSFSSNKKAISHDFGFKKADIILLAECHNVLVTREHAARTLQNSHKLIHFSSGTNEKSSCGQMCFVKNDKVELFKLLADNTNRNGLYDQGNQRRLCELSLFEYKKQKNKILLILSVYKHPEYQNKFFLNDLNEFLQKNIKESHRPVSLFVVGDFNVDFNNVDSNCVKEIFDLIQLKFHLCPVISNAKTFKWMDGDRVRFSQLDWAFKNQNFKFNIKSSVYDIWFSDHDSIWTDINF
ncbi:unnamed protein product [Brachionus calyciflorus]|uniref:ATP-dependent DNA helicase n=1 Tax=Brachionus calyciflorus TaxID=104777 RepID=A0A813TH46_9BILA|nr:unnamed protein product [Brachionus calyciflorus]